MLYQNIYIYIYICDVCNDIYQCLASINPPFLNKIFIMLLNPMPELSLHTISSIVRPFSENLKKKKHNCILRQLFCYNEALPFSRHWSLAIAAAEWRLVLPSLLPNWSLCSLTQSWYNVALHTAKPGQIMKWMGIAWMRLFGIQSTPKEGCRHLTLGS